MSGGTVVDVTADNTVTREAVDERDAVLLDDDDDGSANTVVLWREKNMVKEIKTVNMMLADCRSRCRLSRSGIMQVAGGSGIVKSQNFVQSVSFKFNRRRCMVF